MIEFFLLNPWSSILGIIIAVIAVRMVSAVMRRKTGRTLNNTDSLDAVSRCLVLFEDDMEEAILFVHASIIFQEKVDFSGFAEQFIRIYGREGRFAQRLVHSDEGRMYWTDAPEDWKPMDNISCVEEQMTHEDFEKMLGEMCSTPLPTNNPLWRVVFIQNYKPRDSDIITSAFVWKYHHSIADGFTAMRHVVSRCTPVDETKSMEEIFGTTRNVSARGKLMSVSESVLKLFRAVLKIVFLSKDPPNPCKPNYRARKNSKRVCSFTGLGEEFSVGEIKNLARRASEGHPQKTTVNDILIAAVYRTLARYCEENRGKGGPVRSAPLGSSLSLGVFSIQTPDEFTAAMWVALNSGSPFKFAPMESRWGNEKLGVCYLKVPVKVTPIAEQVGAVHRRIRELIGSPEPYVANRILAAFGSLPYLIAKPLWGLTSDKATISLSNVPGPQVALRWPVNRDQDIKEQIPRTGIIRDLLFFVPPVFDIGPMLCIISYNDRINVGIATPGDWIDQTSADRMMKELFSQSMSEVKKEIIST